MDSFILGFADELTKEAGHPAFGAVARGGTLLGRKVQGMMTRALKRGRSASHKARMKKQSSAALPGKGGPEVKAAVKESKTPIHDNDGVQKLVSGATDARYGSGPGMRYGGGVGNFEGKQAPAFTDKINPTDMPKAFGKKR